MFPPKRLAILQPEEVQKMIHLVRIWYHPDESKLQAETCKRELCAGITWRFRGSF